MTSSWTAIQVQGKPLPVCLNCNSKALEISKVNISPFSLPHANMLDEPLEHMMGYLFVNKLCKREKLESNKSEDDFEEESEPNTSILPMDVPTEMKFPLNPIPLIKVSSKSLSSAIEVMA